MKPYQELTHLGRMRRLWQLAGEALDVYGLNGARLMARMHSFAVQWQPPACPTKRRYDWDGLFQADAGSGVPRCETWPLLPPSCAEPFQIVARRVRQAMDELGQGPDVYGLIHADLGLDANVLFWEGDARAIDFDDSGFGYWMYDLAVALEHCREDAAFPQYRDALLDGYTETRSLPQEQLMHLELFMAASDVYWSLWATGGVHLYPDMREGLAGRMERSARLVARNLFFMGAFDKTTRLYYSAIGRYRSRSKSPSGTFSRSRCSSSH